MVKNYQKIRNAMYADIKKLLSNQLLLAGCLAKQK